MENIKKEQLNFILTTAGCLFIGFIAGNTFQSLFSNNNKNKKIKYSLEDLQTTKSLKTRVENENPELLISKKNVIATSSDVLGPFYVIGAPFRSKLSPISAVGRKLLIKGTLRDTTGRFIPFTVIDFWQVNFISIYFNLLFLFIILIYYFNLIK